jgi:hypothetical protein
MIIFKGNTPLTSWSFVDNNNNVFQGLPADPTKYVLWMKDGLGNVHQSAATASNVSATAGTLQIELTATDTAVIGVASFWWQVQLSNEVNPRTFMINQKVLIEDPTQA